MTADHFEKTCAHSLPSTDCLMCAFLTYLMRVRLRSERTIGFGGPGLCEAGPPRSYDRSASPMDKRGVCDFSDEACGILAKFAQPSTNRVNVRSLPGRVMFPFGKSMLWEREPSMLFWSSDNVPSKIRSPAADGIVIVT